MDLFQLRTDAVVFVALEDLDSVLELELFEEPDHSLCTRLLEPEQS